MTFSLVFQPGVMAPPTYIEDAAVLADRNAKASAHMTPIADGLADGENK